MKNIAAFILAFLSALITYSVLTLGTQQTLSSVVLKGKVSHDLEFTTTAISKLGATKITKTSVASKNGRVVIRFGSGVLLHPMESLELSFQLSSAMKEATQAEQPIVNIYQLELNYPYRQVIKIPQHHLRSFFLSNYFLQDSAVLQFQAGSDKVTLQSIRPFVSNTFSFAYALLALMIAFAVYLLVVNTQWRNLPAFADVELGKHISSAQEFNAINGLRGLAAILVLMSHASPGFYGIHMGLAMLFILSGFLLSKPFILEPSSIFSWSAIQKYILKRLRRILPMYYLFIFISYGVALELDTVIRHFLFVEARGHLWPMTQIFTFYMLLPLVLLLTSAAYRLHRSLPLLILLGGITAHILYGGDWAPYYNGRFHKEFYLYAFLMGVLAAYVQYLYLHRVVNLSSWGQNKLALLTSLFILLTLAWAGPLEAPAVIAPWISNFKIKCLLSAIIVLLVVNTHKNWFAMIFANRLFRLVGVVGFSFYLLHGLGITLVKEFQLQILGYGAVDDRSWSLTLASFVVTYIMAIFAYSYVERPFFGYRAVPTQNDK